MGEWRKSTEGHASWKLRASGRVSGSLSMIRRPKPGIWHILRIRCGIRKQLRPCWILHGDKVVMFRNFASG